MDKVSTDTSDPVPSTSCALFIRELRTTKDHHQLKDVTGLFCFHDRLLSKKTCCPKQLDLIPFPALDPHLISCKSFQSLFGTLGRFDLEQWFTLHPKKTKKVKLVKKLAWKGTCRSVQGTMYILQGSWEPSINVFHIIQEQRFLE